MTLMSTFINHNYLQFNNKFYKQMDGPLMGVPTSKIIAEIFIQNLEHTDITNILKNTTSSITPDMWT
jgi:hypothetical protein